MSKQLQALIFDCDGVLVDTERDGHRVAFNQAFAKKGLDIEWDVQLYGDLLEVAGGKERMRHYFNTHQWPANITDKDIYIKDLHKLKTDCFMQIIESCQLPLRPGVARLVDEAIADGISLVVCSTSNERAVTMVVERLLGKEIIKHPFVVNLAHGFPGTLSATPDNIMFMVRQLPENTVWTLTPHHATDYRLHALSVALGGNVRVGFEDSMYLAPDEKASNNVELVAKARELIELLGRQAASPAETRQMYGIA